MDEIIGIRERGSLDCRRQRTVHIALLPFYDYLGLYVGQSRHVCIAACHKQANPTRTLGETAITVLIYCSVFTDRVSTGDYTVPSVRPWTRKPPKSPFLLGCGPI